MNSASALDPGILRYSEIWGVEDEPLLNTVHTKYTDLATDQSQATMYFHSKKGYSEKNNTATSFTVLF